MTISTATPLKACTNRKSYGAVEKHLYRRSCRVASMFLYGIAAGYLRRAASQDLLVYGRLAVACYAFCHHIEEVIPAEIAQPENFLRRHP